MLPALELAADALLSLMQALGLGLGLALALALGLGLGLGINGR